MKPLFAALLLAAAPLVSAQTSPPAGSARLPPPGQPAQLGLCAACHGVDGRSRTPGTPHIGGQDEIYLAESLRAYRDGRRRAVAMNAISNALQPSDVDELAAWYARQPGFQPAGGR